MKIRLNHASACRQSQSGMVAVLVVMIVLGLLLLLSAANVTTLNWLHQELKLVEKKQTQAAGSLAATNAPPFVSP
ncbi:MAG TPA: hypothetical protein VL527_06850 [Dongiaceae bacterium]|jgi:hypothetical protein|nr:hypothetical protein [Dongiaceae bacterium]